MNLNLEKLMTFKDVGKVFCILSIEDKESRFVGGCVRDAILKSKINDIDIATTLLPDEVECIFAKHKFKTLSIGKNFGTIGVVINENIYEITTLRKDLETDGRKATSVAYTDDWREDALRRDFTINAMSYCPYKSKLYDYFGGVEDLHKGIVRFVGDPETRIKEDFLRILRFFRFYTYYTASQIKQPEELETMAIQLGEERKHAAMFKNVNGYYGCKDKIDVDSLNACIKYSRNINTLSKERIWSELEKIFNHPDRFLTIGVMVKEKIFEQIFDQNISSATSESIGKLVAFEKDCNYKFSPLINLVAISNAENISPEYLARHLKLTNKEVKYLKDVELVIRRIRDEGINIHEASYRNHDVILDVCGYIVSHFTQKNFPYKGDLFAEACNIKRNVIPKFPINGIDIQEHCKISQPQDIGKILHHAEKLWCESKFKLNKQSLIDVIKKIHL